MHIIKSAFSVAICCVLLCNVKVCAADLEKHDVSESELRAANKLPLVLDYENMTQPRHVVSAFIQAANKYYALRGESHVISLNSQGRTLKQVIGQLEDAKKVYDMDAQFDRWYAARAVWWDQPGLEDLVRIINRAVHEGGISEDTAAAINSSLLEWADKFVETPTAFGNGPSWKKDLASTVVPSLNKKEILAHPLAGSTIWAAARLAQSRFGSTPVVSFFNKIAKAHIVVSAVYHGYKVASWYNYTVARANILEKYRTPAKGDAQLAQMLRRNNRR